MLKAARNFARTMTALAVVALGSGALQAQSATALMFYGGSLQKPVLVTGADAATFTTVTAPVSISPTELANRSYLQVAVFWGPQADPANNGTPLANLKPEMAWQHGRFYPAANGKPALLLTTQLTKRAQSVPLPTDAAAFTWGGTVSPKALAVLERLGIK